LALLFLGVLLSAGALPARHSAAEAESVAATPDGPSIF